MNEWKKPEDNPLEGIIWLEFEKNQIWEMTQQTSTQVL